MPSPSGETRAFGNGSTRASGAPDGRTTAARMAARRSGLALTNATLADGTDGTLAATRQTLAAALQEIGVLQRREALLREQVAGLVQAVARARRFAHRDELTGLPNRRLLMDRFNQAVAQAERQHKQVALLFLDVDGFKQINDRFGHAAGDSLLQQVAARLTACIRISDTACRYGGDEFVVLLPEIEGEQNAAAVSQKIRAYLAAPYAIAGTEIQLSTSIGSAVYPVDGRACGELIEASDREMYRNKPGRLASSPN